MVAGKARLFSGGAWSLCQAITASPDRRLGSPRRRSEAIVAENGQRRRSLASLFTPVPSHSPATKGSLCDPLHLHSLGGGYLSC